MNNYINNYERRFAIEDEEKWKTIADEIPYLKFDDKWEVKIAPPWAGAIVRFFVKYNNNQVSVYLDYYAKLGGVSHPYWEIYDHKMRDPARFWLNETKEMMYRIRRLLNKKGGNNE